MAGQRISGTGVAAIGGGAVFLFAALKGKSVLGTLQAVIRGSSPGSAAAAAGIAGTPGSPGSPGSSASGSSHPGNVALGRLMAAAYGWSAGHEWNYLRTGWQEESGWSTTAAYDKSDPYNHAYGIPQANPGTKMAAAGADWKSSASTQIRWGLAYIKSTYGSPTGVPGWSDTGPTAGYSGY